MRAPFAISNPAFSALAGLGNLRLVTSQVYPVV